MLSEPNTSGFGWDDVKKCVTMLIMLNAWDAYMQVKVYYHLDFYILSSLNFYIIY
jgi:hypothetical protein